VLAFNDAQLALHFEIESFVLDGPAAHHVPGGADHAIDERPFDVAAGPEAGGEVATERVVLVGVFLRNDEGGSAEAVGVRVLGRAALPSGVFGPVDFCAFARLAAMRRSDVSGFMIAVLFHARVGIKSHYGRRNRLPHLNHEGFR
jgi:hypothetical protein